MSLSEWGNAQDMTDSCDNVYKRTDIHSWATGTSVWLLVNTKIIQISQSQESSSMHLGM